MSELPASLQRARAAAYAAWRSVTGERENPDLQGYLSNPSSRPEVESRLPDARRPGPAIENSRGGFRENLRSQQMPRPAWAGSLQRPPTMISPEELTGEPHPFPFAPQQFPDSRVERLPDRGAPSDPFHRPLPRTDGPAIMQEPMDREPWRQVANAPQTGSNIPLPAGAPAPQRGMEPPDGPEQPSMAKLEAQALSGALYRAQQQTVEDRRAQGRRLPRPGNPLIGQAWSDPDRRTPRR